MLHLASNLYSYYIEKESGREAADVAGVVVVVGVAIRVHIHKVRGVAHVGA